VRGSEGSERSVSCLILFYAIKSTLPPNSSLRSSSKPLAIHFAHRSWGDKENGVSGHGDTDGHQYTPRRVKGLGAVSVSGISACGFHTAVVGTNGGIWTWGEGKFGR